MRKSLLGLVLVAAMLPMTTVQAAPAGAVGKAVAAYNTETKNAKDAIAAAVAAGLTVEEAMAELLDAAPGDAASIVNAAVAAAPGRAATIVAFAVSKGVPPTVAAPAAAAAAPTQSANVFAAAGLSAPTQSGQGLIGGGTSTPSGITIGGNTGGSTGGGGGGSGNTGSDS